MTVAGSGKLVSAHHEPEGCFWESDAYFKTYFREKRDKVFRYYDDLTVFRYLFFHWAAKWTLLVSKYNVEPYKYHPLPVSDQILLWHPIFAKHISDGILRLERHEVYGSRSGSKPPKSILCRAIFLTFWKRFLVLSLGLVVTNVLSMSIAILVQKLLQFLSDESIKIPKVVGLLAAIIGLQILDGLVVDNLNFYIHRLIYIVHYLLSLGLFQHSLCYRRKFFNNINGSNQLQVCNQILHSCSPDSECSKNPFYCQAMRHQNKDISPKLFSYEWNDSYYFSQAFESVKHIIEFATNFGYGIFLLSYGLKMKLWVLYIVGLLFTFLMLFVEVLNVITLKFIFYLRDYKLTKCNDMFPFLPLIKKMLYDDIAINIITKARNNELSLLLLGFFFFHFNGTLYVVCMNVTFYLIQRYFVKSVVDASVITDVDTASLMASFYIFLRIVHSLFLIPRALKVVGMSVVSFRRIDNLINDSSPNFYASDTKFVGSTQVSCVVSHTTNKIPKDVVVYYKDATFTWVNSRQDLLNKNYEPLLRNVNFELKRGQMAIVTGSKGSGKSNFIKSMLGEMTLVGGSMAVVPLHTSMPIFYASQDIFLQRGTIRSNITFGYRFDEQLYNAVLKAVELEFDISTWEKGDLRVVSDNAHSLSGGQRVRMELARAVYAYLVFHKVNKEYNNSKCSFLMCLDGSFHGLDPYVAKTIFNNLFNLKTGLLVKDDLSVVLTTSKMSLETSLKSSDISLYPNVPVYEVKDEMVDFYAHLHDFVKNKKRTTDFNYLSPLDQPYQLNSMTKDMLNLCSSGSTSRLGRVEVTKSLYSTSFKSVADQALGGAKLNRYKIFLTPAIVLFLLYIVLNIGVNVMDSVKYVVATRLSDYISKNTNDFKDGVVIDFDKIKSHTKYTFNIITMFVSAIMILSFTATISVTIACFKSSRKLHEYCVSSIFKNSSSVVKIKKHVSQMMTYLSCDMMKFDDCMGLFLSLFVLSSMQLLINIVTLFYLIPIAIPFSALALLFISYLLIRYVNATKLMFFTYFETCLHVNSVLEDAISGASVNRSFKKDSDYEIRFYEQRDYKARCKFMLDGVTAWISLSFNWVFSTTTFLVLVLPIVLDKFTKYKLSVGYFGLAISLCSNVLKSFNFFAMMYSNLEQVLVPVDRFKYFVPFGQRLVFDPFHNVHEEYVVNPTKKGVTVNKDQLVKRRAVEFKNENKKFYGLRRLSYHPKITILDVDRYLTSDHSGVELKDVCVYTTLAHTPESMILKHLNVSSNRSEIIGIIGRTGAGKTTLLSVLQNIIANRTGQVLLDGKDLNDIPKVVLRQIIGVLPQLPFVFKGWTVRRFLDPRRLFSDDEINQSLNKCGLLNFVDELPGGMKLDTVIVPEEPVLYYLKGKGGKSRPRAFEKEKSMSMGYVQPGFDTDMLLSNTQLRTLWLARLVLYKHFYRMIVVDEPPEEDTNEEASARKDDLAVPIYDLLQKHFSHCTTFVTAHDVNVLKSCTSVWVIHEGCLVKTCKASDVSASDSISSIIEQNVLAMMSEY
ncbi:hypothetical protein MACJ_003936 [Theileria orientalis]|uniref:ABC transporter n=1 Tax=Theileria orientalis TaxID=68886 RepID=A0A976XK18_THEOR|nr:hypothetical protein MACJ_003936 [Theileria orientalis]